MVMNAVARETVFALRREIARIEGTLPERLDVPMRDNGNPSLERTGHEAGNSMILRRKGMVEGGILPTGSERLDAALGGGLPFAALTEIHGRETRDAGAVAGFALALAALALKRSKTPMPMLWIATGETLSETGVPYAPGIAHRFAIPPEALLFANARKLEDALWVAEEAAAIDALSAVLLEVRGSPSRLDLTATRRLHHRTRTAGRPVYLLRLAGQPDPTAAPVRLVISSAPAGKRRTLSGPLTGSLGPPAFTVTVSRSRTSIPATLTLEWNRDEQAFHERQDAASRPQGPGAVVSVPAGRTRSADAAGPVVAFRRSA